jgi:RNA polymerase sigma factor (sigma-70 family)
MTEAELIKGCINNDRRCQNRLYQLYFPFMSKIAIRYYDNTDDAVSSINKAFLKLLQNLVRYDPQFKLATYLGKILINTILSDLESRSKRVPVYLEDYENEYKEDYSVNESELQLAYDDLVKMILLLPELHRKVFNLFVIDGYTHAEIAEMLVISVPHSKWIVFDSRKRMMKLLNDMNSTVIDLKKAL